MWGHDEENALQIIDLANSIVSDTTSDWYSQTLYKSKINNRDLFTQAMHEANYHLFTSA